MDLYSTGVIVALTDLSLCEHIGCYFHGQEKGEAQALADSK